MPETISETVPSIIAINTSTRKQRVPVVLRIVPDFLRVQYKIHQRLAASQTQINIQEKQQFGISEGVPGIDPAAEVRYCSQPARLVLIMALCSYVSTVMATHADTVCFAFWKGLMRDRYGSQMRWFDQIAGQLQARKTKSFDFKARIKHILKGTDHEECA